MIFIKMVVWFIFSTVVELISAFPTAGILMLLLNFAGVPWLAALGFWNLYWLQMAVYTSVGGATVMGLGAKEFIES